MWAVLLDEEFMAAYTHGILMECADGVLRRQFLRVMLSAAVVGLLQYEPIVSLPLFAINVGWVFITIQSPLHKPLTSGLPTSPFLIW